jgi:transcriptional regulator with XRE-family HTH domain
LAQPQLITHGKHGLEKQGKLAMTADAVFYQYTFFPIRSSSSSSGGDMMDKAKVAVLVLLVASTGSVLDISRAEDWRAEVEARTPIKIVMEDSPVARPDLRSASALLINIREVLNPSITDMATVFGVSRQSVYKWMNDEVTPEQNKFKRIRTLGRVADAFRDAHIRHAHAIVKMKAFDGRSLLDLVAADRLEKLHIDDLIAESRKMDAAYDHSGMARSKAKPTNDWLATVSIPGYIE